MDRPFVLGDVSDVKSHGNLDHTAGNGIKTRTILLQRAGEKFLGDQQGFGPIGVVNHDITQRRIWPLRPPGANRPICQCAILGEKYNSLVVRQVVSPSTCIAGPALAVVLSRIWDGISPTWSCAGTPHRKNSTRWS